MRAPSATRSSLAAGAAGVLNLAQTPLRASVVPGLVPQEMADLEEMATFWVATGLVALEGLATGREQVV